MVKRAKRTFPVTVIIREIAKEQRLARSRVKKTDASVTMTLLRKDCPTLLDSKSVR